MIKIRFVSTQSLPRINKMTAVSCEPMTFSFRRDYNSVTDRNASLGRCRRHRELISNTSAASTLSRFYSQWDMGCFKTASEDDGGGVQSSIPYS